MQHKRPLYGAIKDLRTVLLLQDALWVAAQEVGTSRAYVSVSIARK